MCFIVRLRGKVRAAPCFGRTAWGQGSRFRAWVKPRSPTCCCCGLISATFGWKKAFGRVCAYQPSISAFGEGRSGEQGTAGRTQVLSEAAAVSMWLIVTCHPPLKGRILLGLWKPSPILRQLGGKAKSAGGAQRGEAAQGGSLIPGREGSARDAGGPGKA